MSNPFDKGARWDRVDVKVYYLSPNGLDEEVRSFNRADALREVQDAHQTLSQKLVEDGVEDKGQISLVLAQLGDYPETEDDLGSYELKIQQFAEQQLASLKMYEGSTSNSLVLVPAAYVEVVVGASSTLVIPRG